MKKNLIIVQARMTSTRLPGKVLMPVLGKPLLDYLVERLHHVRSRPRVVLATTTNETDLPLVAAAERLGIACYRGSEDDVLSRYYEAALQFGGESILRITSDCPLLDPAVIDLVMKQFASRKHPWDYVSTTLTRTFPRGMDVEMFTFEALKTAHDEATLPAEREHVTPFLYNNPDRFKLGSVTNVLDVSRHRWTVDTEEDFELVKRIIEALYPSHPKFNMKDCLQLLNENPAWEKLNAHIEQKQYGR